MITRLNIGGPAIHAILLTQALNDGAAFQSILVAGTTAPHEGNMLDFAEARTRRAGLCCPRWGVRSIRWTTWSPWPSMVQLIRRVKPDVVHTHMAKAGTVGRLAARICNVPLIVHTYHGHVFHSYFSPAKTRLFLTIERALGMATQRIIVVGDGQREEIAGFGVAPRAKIESIRLGLELGQFLTAERARGELRRELGLTADHAADRHHRAAGAYQGPRDVLRRGRQSPRGRTRCVLSGDWRWGAASRKLEVWSLGWGSDRAVRFLGWRRPGARLRRPRRGGADLAERGARRWR